MTRHNIDPDQLRLTDIMIAIADVESIGLHEASERKDMLACAYAIAIIGEASNQLSKELREANKHIPWREIIDMRHRIIHGYGSLNKERLLAVVREDIPVLKPQIKAILSQLENHA